MVGICRARYIVPCLRSGRLLKRAILILALFVSLVSCSSRPSDLLAVTHVTVIDMTGVPPLPDQTVVIENRRILSLGSSNTVASDDRAKYIPARTLDIWKKSRSEQMKAISPPDSELHAQLLQKSMNLVAEMHKAGVKILAGTDSPAPFIFPGSSLHDELQLLVEAGLTPSAPQSSSNFA